MEITNELQKFYQNPDAFEILYNILTTVDSVQIAKHVALGIRYYIKTLFAQLPNQDQIYQHLLELCAYPKSSYIRDIIADITTSYIRLEFSPMIAHFFQNWASNLNNVNLSAICHIYPTFVMLPGNEIDESVEAAIFSYQPTGIEDRLDQVLYFINKFNSNLNGEEEDAETEIQPIYHQAFFNLLEIMQQSAHQSLQQHFDVASKQLIYQITTESPLVDYQQTLQLLASVISQDGVTPQIKGLAFNCMNNLVGYFDQRILEEGFSEDSNMKNLFELYMNYALTIASDEDSYDIAPQNIFDNIIPVFSKDENFLNYFWEQVSALLGDDAGKYCILSAIINSLSVGQSFYKDKIPNLCEIMTNYLAFDKVYTMTGGAAGFGELYYVFGDEINEYIVDAVNRTIEVLQDESYSLIFPEMLGLLQVLLMATSCTDDYFQALPTVLNNLFGEETLRLPVLNTFRKLISNSDVASQDNYDELFNFFWEILMDENSGLQAPTIGCLSALQQKNPEAFAEVAVNFFQNVLLFFSSNDSDITYESMRAIGHLAQAYGDDLGQHIGESIQFLMQVAQSDLTPPDNDDEDDEEKEEELDNQFQMLLRNVGTAQRVVSLILKEMPSMMNAETFGEIFGCIENLMTNAGLFPDCIQDAADSARNVGKALLKTNSAENLTNEASRLIGIFVPALESIVDPENIGAIFDVVCDLTSDFGVKSFFPFKDTVLQEVGLWLAKPGLNYSESLHENAARMLRELLDQMHEEAFEHVAPYVEIFNQYMTMGGDFQELALQFFGDLIANCPSKLQADFITSVFNASVESVQNKKSTIALNVIKQIAKTAPQLIMENIQPLLELISQFLNPNMGKNSETMSLQDNSVSLLSAVAMNVLGDNFPFANFAQNALALMPAQYEVEENRDIIPFFFWMYQRVGANYQADFCAALVRLFVDDERDILDNFVSPEQLDQLKALFKQIIPSVGNIQQFVEATVGKNRTKLRNIIKVLNTK